MCVATLNKVTPVKVQESFKAGIFGFLFFQALPNSCEVRWIQSAGRFWSSIKLLGWKYEEPLYSPLNDTIPSFSFIFRIYTLLKNLYVFVLVSWNMRSSKHKSQYFNDKLSIWRNEIEHEFSLSMMELLLLYYFVFNFSALFCTFSCFFARVIEFSLTPWYCK